MPFRLHKAKATFQLLMQRTLISFIAKRRTIHLGGILGFDNDIQEHKADMKLVLDCLRNAGQILFLLAPNHLSGTYDLVREDGSHLTQHKTSENLVSTNQSD
ncbi:hypothetical protein TSMEX_002944 [Taenia solium]|eukprot:TsM_001069100 transcript=TsM_001069100 gene=TsM_001069100